MAIISYYHLSYIPIINLCYQFNVVVLEKLDNYIFGIIRIEDCSNKPSQNAANNF